MLVHDPEVVRRRLEEFRSKLLDTSPRNRLINLRTRTKAGRDITKVVEITGESSSELYKILVEEGRVMKFHGKPDTRSKKVEETPRPEQTSLADSIQDSEFIGELTSSESAVDTTVDQTDLVLNTEYTVSYLQKKLLAIQRDARVAIEEQGVNILFLSLGTLTWYEDENSDEKRVSPLILIPVQLFTTKNGSMRLKWDESDVGPNLSIAAKLKREFQIQLPGFPEELEIPKYLKSIEAAIGERKRWSVQRDAVALAFFSFAKYLMYLDLDPENWPESRDPIEHPTLGAILDRGFEENEAGVTEEDFPEAIKIAKESSEVFDCDGSQTLAILEAQSGRSMIIEGPPGTGKSQTITNLIADYILAGKKVLFLAEKATALDVVFRKLQEAQLSDACLELHSHKANKRAFYSSLRSTISVAAPKAARAEQEYRQIEEAKESLNAYAHAVNTPIGHRGINPRTAMGELILLGSDKGEVGRHDFKPMSEWTQEEFVLRSEVVAKLEAHLKRIGKPADHPYFGCTLDHYLPQDLKDIELALKDARFAVEEFHQSGDVLAELLKVELPIRPSDIDDFESWASFIAHAPGTGGIKIKGTDWASYAEAVQAAAQAGNRILDLKQELLNQGVPEQVNQILLSALEKLKLAGLVYPEPILGKFTPESETLLQLLETAEIRSNELNVQSRSLSECIGAPQPKQIWGMENLAALAQRFAASPDIRDVSLSDPAWRESHEEICATIQFLKDFQAVVAQYDGILKPSAWNADVTVPFECIQANGSKFFKFLNKDYKAAIRWTDDLFFNIPKDNATRLQALRAVKEAKDHRARFESGSTRLKTLFGVRYEALESDPEWLRQVADWLFLLHSDIFNKKVPESVVSRLPYVPDANTLLSSADKVRNSVQNCLTAISQVRNRLVDMGVLGLENGTGDATEKTYRWLLDEFRPAMTELVTETSSFKGKTYSYIQSTIERVGELQNERASLDAQKRHLELLGDCWKGEETDWLILQDTYNWLVDLTGAVELGNLPEGLIRFFDENQSREPLSAAVSRAQTDRLKAQEAVKAVLEKAQLHDDPDDFTEEPIVRQREKLKGWESHVNSLPEMIQYNIISNEAHSLGLTQSVEIAEEWAEASGNLLDSFKRAWYSGVVREAMKSRPVISNFDRQSHEDVLTTFKELDDHLLLINRIKVALAHWRNVPRSGVGGAMGWLKTQFELKRRHKPIRVAMEVAGEAIQEIKPVFLMSPMSVAIYLPPEGPKFDVVIFDEASQVKPEDAFGGIARAEQTIVVGDSKQMPPTSFFDKLTETEEDDDLEEIDSEILAMKDIESVLAMFSSKIPEVSPRRRDLRWHYRSRHDALISTSNRLFYKDRLVVFPNPWRSGAGAGLILRHDPTTIYERGSTRKNPLEARKVALAAYEHVKKNPNLSLGIATFSKAQQQAIQDELFLLRQRDPIFEEFDNIHPFEPLDVKNLENIQGDERDVIFISVGYGKDESGSAKANFGPINRDGGERRLNVLITRARVRCEVFSNIKSGDVNLSESASLGVRALKTYLSFADSGSLDVPAATGKEPESPFEEMVLGRLRLHGFDVDPQVGSCGYFIDMAVKHPEQPGRYVLGIECDGAMYHSAKATRDRDKLRQLVLEGMGWQIHRIWSTDWFKNEDREFDRLVQAIQTATECAGEVASVESNQARSADFIELAREEFDVDGSESTTQLYEEWDKSLHLNGIELHEVSVYKLSELIQDIVRVESPVHTDEVIRRIREAAGVKRAGNRITQHLGRAIRSMTVEGKVLLRNDFLYLTGQESIPVRDRSLLPQQARKIEKVAPEELIEAFRLVIAESFRIEREECYPLVAKKLGFDRTTVQMTEILKKACTLALRRKVIVNVDGQLRMPD